MMRMHFMGILLLALSGLILYSTHCFEVGTTYLTACAGREFKASLSECPSIAVMKMRSLTLFASTDTASIGAAGDSLADCINVSQCKRIIHNSDDTGLSTSYAHLYSWFQNLCEGKRKCDEGGSLPPWWGLTGEIKDDASGTKTCPAEGIKYFTGVFIHFDCLVGEDIPTVAPPPETTPITRPTTPEVTTPFPVFVPIYLPVMQPIEKIILGVVIGLAIVILIVLLIILYCCERYQNRRKFKKLLRMLGAPQAQDDYDDYDDYTKAEAWADGDINMDAIGEYTGVKPDEFLSMTEENLVNTGQLVNDSMYNTMTTMGRRNSCSTLNSRGGGVPRYPSGVINGAYYGGEMDYNTEENLELERRMAAVLDAASSDLDTDNARAAAAADTDDISTSSGGPKYPNTISTEQEYSPAASSYNDDDSSNLHANTQRHDDENDDEMAFDTVLSMDAHDADSLMNAVMDVSGSFSRANSEERDEGDGEDSADEADDIMTARDDIDDITQSDNSSEADGAVAGDDSKISVI